MTRVVIVTASLLSPPFHNHPPSSLSNKAPTQRLQYLHSEFACGEIYRKESAIARSNLQIEFRSVEFSQADSADRLEQQFGLGQQYLQLLYVSAAYVEKERVRAYVWSIPGHRKEVQLRA